MNGIRGKIFLLFFVLFSTVFAQTGKRTIELDLVEKQLPFGLTVKEAAYKPKVALALSGGGARGISQIGVLKSLRDNDITFDAIVGTSMGSIIGGLYSAGYSLRHLDSIVTNAPWNEFTSLQETKRNELFVDQKVTEDKAIFAVRLDGLKPILPKALNSGQKVSNFLNLLSLNAPIHVKKNFDELIYPFRAVSTDLINGNIIVLKDHSLTTAMRASSSVSFLLEPVEVDSMILVDGGIVANVPAKIAAERGADFVIASNTISPLRKREDLQYPWEIADQLVSIPISIITKQQLEYADAVITPELSKWTNDEFKNLEGLIDRGYWAVQKELNGIRQGIKDAYLKKYNGESFFIRSPKIPGKPNEYEVKLSEYLNSKDSVSNKEILYFLNKINRGGGFSQLSSEIVGDTIHISAEETSIVKSLNIKGNSILSNTKIAGYYRDVINSPFNGKALLNSTLKMLRCYRQNGYSLAEVDSIKFNSASGVLNIHISEGIISDIKVSGNTKTNSRVVTREFNFVIGDAFRYDVAAEGLKNLRAMNIFDDSQLMVDHSSNENIITIEVQEKISRLLRVGLRIDNENFTQLSLDLRDENLLGTGTELGAIFNGGIRNRSITLEHKANRIFDTYLTYNIKGFYRLDDIYYYENSFSNNLHRFYRDKQEEYRQTNYGASVGIGTQVQKFGNLLFEGIFQRDRIRGLDDWTGPEYSMNIAALRFELFIDSQNKYPYPEEGFWVNTFYETAQKNLGGDVGYSKLFFDYKSIFTLNSIHTLIPRFSIGFADETLPLSQQFTLGGHNSFFGYRDYEDRGRQVFTSSLEYRVKMPFKLYFDTYLKFRYDLGNIWAKREEIKFKDLRHGIGVTLSLDTPLGPADFSVGRSFIIKESFPNNIISWGSPTFYFTIGYYY